MAGVYLGLAGGVTRLHQVINRLLQLNLLTLAVGGLIGPFRTTWIFAFGLSFSAATHLSQLLWQSCPLTQLEIALRRLGHEPAEMQMSSVFRRLGLPWWAWWHSWPAALIAMVSAVTLLAILGSSLWLGHHLYQ